MIQSEGVYRQKVVDFGEEGREEGEGRDFPGSPVAKTSLSNAEGPGLIPGGGAKILHASWPKNQNRNNIVTNSIKTFKIVHIKKNLREKKKGGSHCRSNSPDPFQFSQTFWFLYLISLKALFIFFYLKS